MRLSSFVGLLNWAIATLYILCLKICSSITLSPASRQFIMPNILLSSTSDRQRSPFESKSSQNPNIFIQISNWVALHDDGQRQAAIMWSASVNDTRRPVNRLTSIAAWMAVMLYDSIMKILYSSKYRCFDMCLDSIRLFNASTYDLNRSSLPLKV